MAKDTENKGNGVDKGQGAAAGAPNNALPLFFKAPQPLDVKRHAAAAINPNSGFGFSRLTNSIPLNAIEFIEAGRYYPIVFTSEPNIMPAVVVGLEQENYFVKPDGSWKEDTYVPAYVRKYPFIFMEVAEEEKFYLCIDEQSPHYLQEGGNGGLAFFDGEKPSTLSQNALEFCTAFHKQYEITRALCEDLKKHDLFTMNQSDIQLVNGRKIRLGGFQLIDEAKLNALPDEVFLDFRKKGWLPFIYFSLASLTQWKRLADIAASLEPDANAA